MCISEGDVDRVGCPDPECVKKNREANEEEVARVVSDAEVRRWKWLREKRDFDKGSLSMHYSDLIAYCYLDPTLVHCPIAVCQAPVPKPSDVDNSTESGWNRLRQCSRCGFSFCAFCKRTW
jgi:E3 ubiquitin-protein ligase RNF14